MPQSEKVKKELRRKPRFYKENRVVSSESKFPAMNFDPLPFAEAKREIDFTQKISEKTVLSSNMALEIIRKFASLSGN